jgi:hypothetical protein
LQFPTLSLRLSPRPSCRFRMEGLRNHPIASRCWMGVTRSFLCP